MRYAELAPSPDLAPWVRCFWSLAGDGTGGLDRVLPDGSPELIFHWGDRFGLERDRALVDQERVLVAGQLRAAIRLRPGRAVGIFAVRFRPAGLFPFLGGRPLDELTDDVAALDGVGHSLGDDLAERLLDRSDDASRRALIEGRLRARLHRLRPRPSAVAMAASVVESAGGVVALDAVADRVGLGVRQLERRFRQEVGLTPKALARIVRFRCALDRLERAAGRGSAAVAAATGYCDQAHLVREFTALTGVSPTRLLAERALLP